MMNLNQEKKEQLKIVTTTNVLKNEKYEDQSDKIFIKVGKNGNFINENKKYILLVIKRFKHNLWKTLWILVKSVENSDLNGD